MPLSISSAFDGGSIGVVKAESADDIQLTIPKDNGSEFAQWFYFRLSGAAGEACTIRFTGLEDSAYPAGWPDYDICVSEDRTLWMRAPSTYDKGRDGGTLTVELTPETNAAYIAYFAPYTYERHLDLIAETASMTGVRLESLGKTLDGRDMDLLTMGEGPLNLWFIARQHPGESMAEWWMEGALDRLTDPADPVARVLREKATLRIVPNMNPDGSFRGHLRTNAIGVNLNREWHAPSLGSSPEVYLVLERMKETGVDFCLDVHGDEAISNVFLAGFEGIPSHSEENQARFDKFSEVLKRISPDFQTEEGYPPSKPGKANLSICTNQVAERFGCLAATLEMPFKDAKTGPNPMTGWSPERSMLLARDCLAATMEMLGELR